MIKFQFFIFIHYGKNFHTLWKKYQKKHAKRKGKIARRAKTNRFFTVDVSDIRDSVETDDFEICGFKEDETYILSNVGSSQADSVGRKFCDYGRDYQNLWHTHPRPLKYYPSKEDLVKVLKRDVVSSEIFTAFGKWEILCEEICDDELREELKEKLKPILDGFYHKTKKFVLIDGKYAKKGGIVYNREAIEILITDITALMEENGISYYIGWEPWE